MRGAHGSMPKAASITLLAALAACVPAASEANGAEEEAAAPLSVSKAPPPTPTPAPLPPPEPVRADFVLTGQAEQGGAMTGLAPSGTERLLFNGQPVEVAKDGRFLIAFDRDAAAEALLVAELANGKRVERTLAVTPGQWRIEHVNAPYRGSASSSAEFQRRRPAELAQIGEARARKVESDGWRQSFIWPVKGRFSGFFGSQRVYQGKPGSYHSGTDIAVPAGTPFAAPADGVVVLAADQPFTLEGKLLIVDHGMGLNSAFLHCQSLDVKVGDRVVQGQRLGTVGATGRATGPHMHWGMKWGAARLDPGKLVGAMASP
ncbi:M23 family metallopeptidase [Sphingopyxis sp. MWB1]|uniref:M23 family metallopeptidase n=1 Tax=Sphingopyxis sp. MWB1 TaxID=1537715 RepID=UPI00051A1189|nr:M23 family metallopeptidase [Sphingopyxis sp. MWB1]